MNILPRRSLGLGLLLLMTFAAAAVGLHKVQNSSATFTTVSQTLVRGKADRTVDWLGLLSQRVDTVDGSYATRRLTGPPEVPAAEGVNEQLTVDLGGYPDYKQDFPLYRVFTLVTPTSFPDPAVNQITVTATLVADPNGQPLFKPTLTGLNGNGNRATITMATSQKCQLNVTVRAKRNFNIGTTYYPHVLITVTFTGSPANYYLYDIPMAFTDAGR